MPISGKPEIGAPQPTIGLREIKEAAGFAAPNPP
jgi:hypothetical protein